MAISLYDSTIAVANHALATLLDLLEKVKAHQDPESLTSARLYPDMLPFSTQVLIVANFAKKMVERLVGRELEAWADDEKTADELVARVNKTLDLLKTVKKEEVDGVSAEKVFDLKMGPLEAKATTGQYVLGYALPNMFFHLTTAYDILRMKGIQLGKADYLKHFVTDFVQPPAPAQQ